MDGYLYVLFWLVSFLASVAGAVCGIGGGVIIKPVLDAFGVLSVSTISFLSGCTVLGMSCYSMIKNKTSGELLVDAGIGTPLAIGAALGGVLGKWMFQFISEIFADKDMAGAVQAFCLLLITVGTLVYTIKKEQIQTHELRNPAACVSIGLVLGILSSFLGIGGGPVNLVVLFYFFSMDTKSAAQNSLYIIWISQITSLSSTLVTKTVPEFSSLMLVLMVVGGILGGLGGHVINKKMNTRAVDRLFIVLMVVIIGINIYNIFKYLS
ncbi:sulfite exporter TauE/SafE family protein [Lachnospiraceae bacterium 54-53]